MIYLVGGARQWPSRHRQRLVETEGMRELQTDVVRTVLHRVLPNSMQMTKSRSTSHGSPSSGIDTLGRQPKRRRESRTVSSLRALPYQRISATSPASNWRGR